MTLRKCVSSVVLLLIAMVVLPATADVLLKAYDRVRVFEPPRQIGEAKLTDQDGQPFDLKSLGGQVVFILFGYTNCPDVCPVGMERMRELHESGALKGARVAYVMISIDGERDTPAAMKAFLAKFSPEFIGLTAQPSLVKPIATQFSAVFFKGGHKGHADGYDVSHSPQIFVLDPAGRLRAEVYSAPVATMAELARALLAEPIGAN